MRVTSARVLGLSLAILGAVGLTGGLAFALLADRIIAYGIGTGLLIVGIVVVWLALLAATEPPGGWASRGRSARPGRRSLIARVADSEQSGIEGLTAGALVVWGVTVGGVLIVLSLIAFVVSV